MPDEPLVVVVEEEVQLVPPDEIPPDAPERRRPSYPRLGGGNQKSFRLTGRITRYISARRARHEVSEAEVVRSMLNERIDYEEMMERAHCRAVSEALDDRRIPV